MDQQLDNIFRILSGAGNQSMNEIGLGAFVFLLVLSLASSLVIAQLYLFFYANRATGSQVHRAFPLLGISITAIFIAIQFSLPLSLGLLGALSIVRFRTPIKEPEEIGFIMLVIASALACAILNLGFLGILLLVALVALLIQRFRCALLHGCSRGRLDRGVPAQGGHHRRDGGGDRSADIAAQAGAVREPVSESGRHGDLVCVPRSVGRRAARSSDRAATAIGWVDR